ncbi:uncharacterized protein LY79DRAFT_49369 [Colletotrichum navitas]|uniref:Secreted protein n=1 Tax=Colletotrichum navitas TaxID=681940 RepID=A0AAD8V8S8_9PEZI|nr:uncharacterized protein LY79DRAFT_49369 [Colletotrichum navitas]KAK1596613.1 hypothetical protein LY79DRAFT_49369 [Colletotrichum navitas]
MAGRCWVAWLYACTIHSMTFGAGIQKNIRNETLIPNICEPFDARDTLLGKQSLRKYSPKSPHGFLQRWILYECRYQPFPMMRPRTYIVT